MKRKRFPRLLGVTVAGLVGLTGWNVTRSKSLDDAGRAYARGLLVIALQDSLDHRARQPWSREASRLAALSLSRLDHADAAEPYYTKAGRLTLDELQVQAYGLVRGNHRERAIHAYEEILKRWPDDLLALRRLAAVQMTRSNDPEVLKLAERLIAVPGGAAIGYTLRGVVYHNDKNREGAVEAFERVVGLDPELREMPLPRRLFWGHLAYDLIALGRPAEARQYLARALLNNQDAYLMNALGRAHELEGSIPDAERCYRQATGSDPKYVPAYVNLAKIESHRGKDHDALNHLRLAEELAPGQYDVLYTLGLTYRRLGQDEEGRRYQARAERLRAKPGAAPAPAAPKAPLPRYAL